MRLKRIYISIAMVAAGLAVQAVLASPATAALYIAQGTATSTNLLSGSSASSITNFHYNIATLPATSSVRIQFSKDNATWYSSAGALNGWDTLALGQADLSLAAFVAASSWTNGDPFYYKLEINSTADLSATPTIDDIRLDYTPTSGYENVFVFDNFGNVGIGTTSPSGKLDIHGAGTATGVNTQWSDLTGAAKVTILDNGNVGIGTTAPSQLFQVNNSGSTAFVVTSGGNVGIGNTSPGAKLEINNANNWGAPATSGVIQTYGTFRTRTGGGVLDIGALANGSTWLQAGEATALGTNYHLLLQPNGGNVGIGTTAPTNLLDVAGGVKIGAGYAGIGTTAPLNGLLVQGNVGIGTTSPVQKLHVEGHCITGDAELSIWNPQTSQIGKMRFDAVKGGEMVMSLDEKTGKLVPAKIKGLLDMGVQPIFKITTEDGREIRTTGNHPYLAKQESLLGESTNSSGEIDDKKSSFQAFGVDALEKFKNSSLDSFSAQFINIENNNTARSWDIEANDICKIVVESEQDLRVCQGVVKDFLVSGFVHSDIPSSFDLKAVLTQCLNKGFGDAMVGEDAHKLFRNLSGTKKNFGQACGLLHELASELKRGQNITASDAGIFSGNFVDSKTSGQKIDNICHSDAGSLNAGLAETNFGINSDALKDSFNHKDNDKNYCDNDYTSEKESLSNSTPEEEITSASHGVNKKPAEIADSLTNTNLAQDSGLSSMYSDTTKSEKSVKSPQKAPQRAMELGGIEPPGSWMISHNPHQASPKANELYHENAEWTKVAELSEGREIAVANLTPNPLLEKGEGGEAGEVEFVRIAKIEQLDPEQVWDIEVEGTHNFVANGIIAHNTYINGNVGIGTTAVGTYALNVNGSVNAGVLTATSFNGNFITTGTGTLTLNNKTLTLNNSLAFTGADSKTINFGTNNLTFSTSGDYTLTIPTTGTAALGTGAQYQMAYWNTANTLTGSNNFWFDGTNVGIGTTSIGTYKLNVGGSVNATSYYANGSPIAAIAAGTITGQTLWNNAGTWTSTLNLFNDGTNVGIGTTLPSQLFQVNNSGSTAFVVTSGGNVGIGTTSPLSKLVVVGPDDTTGLAFDVKNSSGTSKFTINDYGALANNPYIAWSGSGVVIPTTSGRLSITNASVSTTALTVNATSTAPLIADIQDNGTSVFAIQDGGNVGIGTTNPGYDLTVKPSASGGGISLRESDNGYESFRVSGYVAGGYLQLFTNGTPTIILGANTASQVSYFNAGNVGIGTTSPKSKLAVSGGVGIGTTAPGSLYLSTKAPDGGLIVEGNVGIGTTDPGSYRLYLAGAEAYCDQTTCWNDASDLSLKKNIRALEYGLTEVMRLNPVRYTLKNYDQEGVGLIAQDVEKIIPEVVSGEEGHMGISYGGLAPILINAIKQQQTQISDVNLKTSQNVETVGQLQKSVDDNLTVISSNFSAVDTKLALHDSVMANVNAQFTALDTKVSNIDVQLADLASKYTALDTGMSLSETEKTDLQNRLTAAEAGLVENQHDLITFEKGTNDTLSSMLDTEDMLTNRVLDHEDRLKALEAKIATMTVSTDGSVAAIPANVITMDAGGNTVLVGIFEAKSVVAGAFSVKNEKGTDAPTMGDAAINPVPVDKDGDGIDDVTGKAVVESDGKTVKILTKAATTSAKIMVTPVGETPVNWIISSVVDGNSFTITLDKETAASVKFNWWIVEEK